MADCVTPTRAAARVTFRSSEQDVQCREQVEIDCHPIMNTVHEYMNINKLGSCARALHLWVMMNNREKQTYAVFGASRGIGGAFVEQALARGHRVVALLRDPERMATAHPRLRVLVGDATVVADVRRAVDGVDAVVCALGAPAFSKERVRERGTAAIVRAMEQVGVERLACVSVLGVGETKRELPFFLLAT